MLCRPPRPRWPPSRPRHDGYQNEFPVYHSRDSKRPCLPPNRPGYHIRPSFHPYNSHDFSKDHIPRRGAGTPLRYQNQAQSLHSQGLHSSRLPMPRYSDKHQDLDIQNCDDYQLENSGYQQNFRDPYTINEGLLFVFNVFIIYLCPILYCKWWEGGSLIMNRLKLWPTSAIFFGFGLA